MPPHGANEAARTTTTSRPPALRNADAFNRPRRSMSGLSPAGTEMAQGCARALQKRNDNNGCAARLSPQTLLFATQSLTRFYNIAEGQPKKACRLHPSARATGKRWAVPDTHRSDASFERDAKCSVIVANEIRRRAVPGTRFGDLARKPLCRWVSGHHNPQQLPPSMAENKKREQLLKGNRRNHKEINRCNPLHMIAKEFHDCNGRSRRDTM
jgi:hypothetical protein